MLLNKQFHKKVQKEIDQIFQARYREAQALVSTKQKQKKKNQLVCTVLCPSNPYSKLLYQILNIIFRDIAYHSVQFWSKI